MSSTFSSTGSTDKAGGDIMQGNHGGQLNGSFQDLNAVGVGGVGAVGAMGGAGMATGDASQTTAQNQNQANIGASGFGGGDNLSANTNINV